MTKTITSTLVTTYTYDAANRLATQNGQSIFAWDNNGNLLQDGNTVYAYDLANRLISISGPDLAWSAVYNGDGVRLKQIANDAVTTYTLDYAAGYRILAEATAQGTTIYLYGYECLGEYANNAWLYYLNTVAGYVRQTTDANAQIVSAWVFSPDGLVLVGPQGAVSHLVCGGVYDWATGLIYQNGRYFDPTLGIWLGLVPLVVIQSWQGRKKRRRGSIWPVLLFLIVCAGVTACVPAPTPTPCPPEGSYRLTDVDWEGSGLVVFASGNWGTKNQEAALLALDMVHVAIDTSPERLIRSVRGWAGEGPVNFIPIDGTSIGAGYAAGNILMYAANVDNAYLSSGGVYTLIHETVHGIDESLGDEGGSFTSLGNYNSVGWEQDEAGNWTYSGSTDYGSGNGPANNYIDTPAEDFANAFTSVVIEQLISKGRLTSIDGTDLSGIIRFTGDENGDGVVGIDELGPVDDERRRIVLDAFARLR